MRNDFLVVDEVLLSGNMQRLRNEWPNGIIRQLSDEKVGVNRQTFDGGGFRRNQMFSSDSDDSSRRLAHASYVIRSDSDSDSDPKKWTKNPLVVRRVKRSDKLKQAEKRFSGTENVFSSKNRDSLVSQGNEETRDRTANVSVKNANLKDEGSGSKGNSKYQRLEQMRKMRLNLSVTSDEENVPQRPQPHRWSGSNIRSVPVATKDTEPVPHQGMVRSQFGPEFHLSVNSPATRAPQVYLSASYNIQSPPAASLYHPKQQFQHNIETTTSPLSNFNTGLRIQPGSTGHPETKSRFSHTQTQVAGHFPEYNVTSSRQAFHPLSHMAGSQNSSYKIAEINSSRSNPSVFGNSSSVTTHRFTSQHHVPSIDSALDSKPNANTTHPFVPSQNPTYFKARQSPTQDRIQTANVLRPSSYTTPGLEKRLKSTNDNVSKSTHKIPRTILPRSGLLEANDDSLDELVESNIQYLSSDVDTAKPKKSSNNSVIKFSSLPDHGRVSSRGMSNSAPQNQPSIQVQASTSIQVHVTLPAEIPHAGTSLIQIAPSVASDYLPSFGFRNQLTSQPDLIPRNFSHDVYSPLSQTRNDSNNKENMWKSVSQMNARADLPGHLSLGTVHPRVDFGDRKPRSDTEISLHAPKVDKGMFSDAEYDIEVSERVKKWETFMKVRDLPPSPDKKNLLTINENTENDNCVPPNSDIHKSVIANKQSSFASSYASEPKHASQPRALSIETNTRRFFQVFPDPRLQPQSVNKQMFQAPISLRPEKTFTSASDLRQQMLANRVHPLPITSGPVQATYKPPLPTDNGQQVSSQRDTPVVKRTSDVNDVRNSEKRGSKFREELNEISYIKSDSVGNLRRRFDTDSTNATSEDDKKSVSTASAKLSLPSKEYSSRKEATDWSQVLPSYHTKMTDSEVWSPNLESTQGVPVSIERVTARTLQTIPFSDDPFWKEIEQMTTFDPTNKEGLLTTEPIRSHHQVHLLPAQSSTLPSQPHRNVTSVGDKLQKSKSLYTPNITPLTVDVSGKPSSTVDVSGKPSSTAATALDDVLSDIHRSPMGRQQLSPKKRYLEVDSSPTNVVSSNVSQFLKLRPKSSQFGKSENGQLMFTNPGNAVNTSSVRTLESGPRGLNRSDMLSSQAKQPLQFSQQPRQHLPPNVQNRQPQTSQGFTNNYQLDPNLLKQKLLNTGLVVDTEMEDLSGRGHYQSSSLDRPVHDINVARNITAPLSTRIVSKLRPEEPLTVTSSQDFNQPKISASNKQIFLTPPGKQSGPKTLDEIQKALAPFSSTSYQPDLETLYGTSNLQAFKDNRCDTSKGAHTSATGWSYHTEPNTDIERSNTVDSSLSGGSSRLQEVNESMDDLTNLARGVELRINEIKIKLEKADERSLDYILLSLRKLTPEVKSQETDTANFEDYYTNKKSKLSDALSELDRIYTSLDLNTDDLGTLSKQEKPRSGSSNYVVRGPQEKSVHLRPMQTRISSVFIRDLDTNKMPTSTQKESEFDVISKSFQAIVDEVNQTTDLLSRAVERSKPDNMAPETHKLASKAIIKPGNAEKDKITTENSSAKADTASQNSLNEILNTVKVTSGAVSSSAVLPSSSGQQQTRFRPVKDNKIIQDDKATNRDSEEKVFRALPSAKASPTLVRKVFSGDQDSQAKQQLPSHGDLVKQTAEARTAPPLQINVKEQAKTVDDKDGRKSDQSFQLSPSSSKNMAMSSVENTERESTTGINSGAPLPLASTAEIDKLPTTLQIAAGVSKIPDNSAGVELRLSSTSASTASSIFVPAVTNSKQARLGSAGTKTDEWEGASKSANKTKRQLGSGVAMILGKFSSSQESIDGSKKGTNIRSVDNDGSGTENTEKDDVSIETQHANTAEGKISSEGNMKSPVRPLTNTKPGHSLDVKATALSPLERKLVDPEAKILNSGASSPQPSSPVNKPPQSPWKRHTSDPEKQSVTDAIKVYSPKFISKIPRPASSNGSTASDGYFTPKEIDSPRQVIGSPSVTTSKERPPIWKSPNNSPRSRGRPHSFHELISVFEKDSSNRLQTLDKFRKCASADEVSSSDILVGKGFQRAKTVPEETTPEK